MAARAVKSRLDSIRQLVGSRFYVLDARRQGDSRGLTLVLKLSAREERLLKAPIGTLLNRGVVRFMAEFFARPRAIPKSRRSLVQVIAKRESFSLYRASLPRSSRRSTII